MEKHDKKEAAKKLLESFQVKKKQKSQPSESKPLIDSSININSQQNGQFDTSTVSSDSHFIPNNEVSPAQYYDNITTTPNNVQNTQEVTISSPLTIPIQNQSINHNIFTPTANNESIVAPTNNINNSETPENETEESDNLFSQVELAKVCKQLEFHKKTVEFLVMEKNELVTRVGELEAFIVQMNGSAEDLKGRLNMSRHSISNLELENYNIKQKNQQLETQLEKLDSEIAKYHLQDVSLKSKYKDADEELRETKTLLNAKIMENKELASRIDDLTFRINSGEFHYQQSPNQNVPQENFQEQIQYLSKQLQEAETEKTQSNIQYQQYVEQLNIQIKTMRQRQEELEFENERLCSQETAIMEQMNSLEKQLQVQSQRNQPQSIPLAEPSISKEEFENVRSNCNELMVELQKKNSDLVKITEEVNKYQQQIEELTETLQRMRSETPDVAKLNAANESDRLAAQKATSQNTQLKLDIEHLQEAYDEMTQDKLELTELLQAEKELSKTLTLKLAENEETYKGIHSKLLAKDEEMIRLQAASSELEKEMLKHAQLEDRLQHYEVQNASSDSLQSELQYLQKKVALLSAENERLKSNDHNHENGHSCHDHGAEDDHSEHTHENGHSCDDHDHKVTEVKKEILDSTMGKSEAMEKLEEKFINLMKEVADLSDEKQKLEHLVVQLQAETETICEYITLYQKQRSILKQKEQEKNAQLSLLAKERENMKEQLDHLNSLVNQLVNRDNNSNTNNLQEANTANDEAIQTAGRIMDLLSQIKSSHLIEPDPECNVFHGIHQCTWCSGKLITV